MTPRIKTKLGAWGRVTSFMREVCETCVFLFFFVFSLRRSLHFLLLFPCVRSFRLSLHLSLNVSLQVSLRFANSFHVFSWCFSALFVSPLFSLFFLFLRFPLEFSCFSIFSVFLFYFPKNLTKKAAHFVGRKQPKSSHRGRSNPVFGSSPF